MPVVSTRIVGWLVVCVGDGEEIAIQVDTEIEIDAGGRWRAASRNLGTGVIWVTGGDATTAYVDRVSLLAATVLGRPVETCAPWRAVG